MPDAPLADPGTDVAAGRGDSGGPVFTLTNDGGVEARGTIAGGSRESPAGATTPVPARPTSSSSTSSRRWTNTAELVTTNAEPERGTDDTGVHPGPDGAAALRDPGREVVDCDILPVMDRLGTLDWVRASTGPTSSARRSRRHCRRWGGDRAAGVLVAAIDPELADTAEFCAAYDVPLDVSANCVVLAARRAGPASSPPAWCSPPPGPTSTGGPAQARGPQGVVRPDGRRRRRERHGLRGHHARRPAARVAAAGRPCRRGDRPGDRGQRGPRLEAGAGRSLGSQACAAPRSWTAWDSPPIADLREARESGVAWW